MHSRIRGKKRTATPHSRLGCNTCKERRVKCDEARPCCGNCVRSGLECSGPKDAPGNSDAYQVFSIQSNTTRSRPLPLLKAKQSPRGDSKKIVGPKPCAHCRSRQTACNGSHDACLYRRQWNQQLSNAETRSMGSTILQFRPPGGFTDRLLACYFQSEAQRDMDGYFTPDFWTEVVLPLSHVDPCVRYSISALSAFHKDHIASPKDGSTSQITSRASFDYQYIRATQILRGYMKRSIQPSKKLILVCCLIFFCIELAQEQFQNAEKHIRSGLQIVSEWRKNLHKELPTNMNSKSLQDIMFFEDIFERLDAFFSFAHNYEMPYLTLTSAQVRGGEVSFIPSRFESVGHSSMAHIYVENWISQFLSSSIKYSDYAARDIPPSTRQERAVLLAEMYRWDVPFALLLEGEAKDFSSMWSTTARALMNKMHWLAMRARFQVLTSNFTLERPNFDLDPEFAEILTAAETLTAPLIIPAPGNKRSRSLLFRVGFAGALWMVGILCKDNLMRSKAILLLRAWDRTATADSLQQAFLQATSGKINSEMTEAETREFRKLALGIVVDDESPTVYVPWNFIAKASTFGLRC